MSETKNKKKEDKQAKDEKSVEREMIGHAIYEIAGERNLSQEGLSMQLQLAGHDISQSTISKIYSGNMEPNISFIRTFCQTFNVSADTILCINNTAISNNVVTPFTVLYNLNLILKQFNFNIEFSNNNSKVMLTTDDRYMMDFLSNVQFKKRIANENLTEYLTIEEIDKFCKARELQMWGKRFTALKDLYIIEQISIYYEECEAGTEPEAYLRQIKKEIREDLEFVPLNPENIFALKWEKLSTQEKKNIAPKLLQKYLNIGKGKNSDKDGDKIEE